MDDAKMRRSWSGSLNNPNKWGDVFRRVKREAPVRAEPHPTQSFALPVPSLAALKQLLFIWLNRLQQLLFFPSIR
jgi:hypothetical protein